MGFLVVFCGKKPSQALPRQIPPFVTYGDIFPRSGGSLSSKGELPSKARLRGRSRFPRKKHRFPMRKAVLFSTFFCPVVENPVQF